MTTPRVEMMIGGAWVDVTAWCYTRDGMSITRGRQQETATTSTGTMSFTLNNRDGRWNPRNPASPWFGQLGRNTPVRVSVPAAQSRLTGPSASGPWVSTPWRSAWTSSTVDVAFEADMATWQVSSNVDVAYVHGSGWTWAAQLTGQQLTMKYSADGTTLVLGTTPSVLPPSGRLAVRVALSGGSATWYTAPTLDAGLAGGWVQTGRVMTGFPSGSLYAATGGALSVFPSGAPVGCSLTRLQVRTAGTLTADLDVRPLSAATSWTDSTGAVWTVGTGAVDDRDWRWYGYVSEWPTRWGTDNVDVYATATSSGIMRRLESRKKTLQSCYFRGVTKPGSYFTNLKAYWPMEEAAGASSFSTPVVGCKTATWTGTPTLAADTSFQCSGPLPTIGTAVITGNVPKYADTGAWGVSMLMNAPSVPSSDAIIMRINLGGGTIGRIDISSDGTAGHWVHVYAQDGSLVQYLDILIGTVGPGIFIVSCSKSGSSTSLVFSRYFVGDAFAHYSPMTFPGWSGVVTSVQIGTGSDLPSGTVVGHLAVQASTVTTGTAYNQLMSWAGEGAAARVARLCLEEGVPLVMLGATSTSLNGARMGIQTPAAFMDLLRECEQTDLGMLGEASDQLALTYRPWGSLAAQQTRSIPYGVTDAFDATDDDQATVNLVTVTDANGATATDEVTTGTLSTQDPGTGQGVGVYDTSITVNTAAPTQLPDIASWTTNVGTIDAYRYPKISIKADSPDITPAILADLDALKPGSRITVTNPPSWVGPNSVDLMVLSIGDTFDDTTRTIELAASPYDAWQCALWDDKVHRYDSATSTLNAGITTTATSLQVAFTDRRWSTTAAPFDIAIEGERITVTAVTGTTSPQTFTVTRSINGIVKAHTAGAPVHVWDSFRWAKRGH